MPIAVWELWDSRDTTVSRDTAQVELKFAISGTSDDIAARQALIAAAPATYAGLAPASIRVTPIGQNLWEGAVQYSTPPTLDGGFSIEIDMTGANQHITHSLATVARYAPPGKTAPDFQGAIGVTADNVEGADIIMPNLTWTENHRIPLAGAPWLYFLTVHLLAGCVNSTTFRVFDPGTVLFTGARAARKNDEDWDFSFSFAASPNANNLTIGDITGINKKGWEYLWVRYEDREDTDAHTLVKAPAAVYVEKVYREADFAALGI